MPLVAALEELGTERPVGFGCGKIPVSKMWDYIDRFRLPDWWEPILLQADNALVAAVNERQSSEGTDAAQRH